MVVGVLPSPFTLYGTTNPISSTLAKANTRCTTIGCGTFLCIFLSWSKECFCLGRFANPTHAELFLNSDFWTAIQISRDLVMLSCPYSIFYYESDVDHVVEFYSFCHWLVSRSFSFLIDPSPLHIILDTRQNLQKEERSMDKAIIRQNERRPKRAFNDS